MISKEMGPQDWFQDTRAENERRFWYANAFLVFAGILFLVWGLAFDAQKGGLFAKTLLSTTGIVFLAFVAQNLVFALFHAGQAYQRRPMILAMYPNEASARPGRRSSPLETP